MIKRSRRRRQENGQNGWKTPCDLGFSKCPLVVRPIPEDRVEGGRREGSASFVRVTRARAVRMGQLGSKICWISIFDRPDAH